MVERVTRAEADRILSDPSDAPPALGGVSRLLRDAAHLPAADDPSPTLLTAMADAAAEGFRTPVRATGRRRTLAKVAAGVTAGLALTATGAAAATGSLPDALQDRAAAVVGHLGIDLPDSADDADDDGIDGQSPHTHGTDVSDVATDPDVTGADKGPAVSEKADDGRDVPPPVPNATDAPRADGATERDEVTPPNDGPGTGQAESGQRTAPAEPVDPPAPTQPEPSPVQPEWEPAPQDEERSSSQPDAQPGPGGGQAR